MGFKFNFKSAAERNNPYLNYSKRALLNQYRTDNWSRLNSEEKIELLQATGNMYAHERGLNNAPSFKEEKDVSLYGGYNSRFNTVSVNLSACSNPYEALDTVAHEVNHACQEHCPEQYSEGASALIKAQSGAFYIQSSRDYDRQTIEIDSNNAGLRFTMECSEQIKNDPSFIAYLDKRISHFQSGVNDYANNNMRCTSVELAQVSNAFSAGEINIEERKNAESYIENNEICQERENLNSTVVEFCAQNQYVPHDPQMNRELLDYAKELHGKYNASEEWPGKEKLSFLSVLESHEAALAVSKASVQKEIEGKMNELSSYITANNMERYEADRDNYVKQLGEEINSLRSELHNLDYHQTELTEDRKLLAEELHVNVQTDNTLKNVLQRNIEEEEIEEEETEEEEIEEEEIEEEEIEEEEIEEEEIEEEEIEEEEIEEEEIEEEEIEEEEIEEEEIEEEEIEEEEIEEEEIEEEETEEEETEEEETKEEEIEEEETKEEEIEEEETKEEEIEEEEIKEKEIEEEIDDGLGDLGEEDELSDEQVEAESKDYDDGLAEEADYDRYDESSEMSDGLDESDGMEGSGTESSMDTGSSMGADGGGGASTGSDMGSSGGMDSGSC